MKDGESSILMYLADRMKQFQPVPNMALREAAKMNAKTTFALHIQHRNIGCILSLSFPLAHPPRTKLASAFKGGIGVRVDGIVIDRASEASVIV